MEIINKNHQEKREPYQPKMSIVTICYNCKDVIEKTIRSVLDLTYKNVEYIVIDGGSTDGTVDVIKKYIDGINYFVSERDKGIYDAMNKGVNAATGDWINFMNAGDFFADKDVLEQVLNMMDNEAVVVHGDCITQCKGYYYREKPVGEQYMAIRMPIIHQSAFIRLDYHKEHLYDIKFRSSGDYNFFYQCHFHDHCKFQYVPVLVSIFDNTEGMSKDNHALSLHENLRIWNKEKDFCFRFKQESHLLKYRIIMWLKKNLYDEERNKEVGINRARRSGWDVKIGDYWQVIHG